MTADDPAYLGANGDLVSYNLYAYCSNNPVNNIDFTGNSALAIGIFIGGSTIIGGIAGTFISLCTGGNVWEGMLEGAALGAVASTSTVLIPWLLPTASVATVTATTFGVSAGAGMLVDLATQSISHAFSENSNDHFNVDEERLLKTAFTTGIAGVVPTYGNPSGSVFNATGSLVIGFNASFFNSAIEIILTRIFNDPEVK